MDEEDIGSFGLIFELYFVVRKYEELFSHAEDDSREALARAGLVEAFQPVIMHWIMLNKASAEKWVVKVRGDPGVARSAEVFDTALHP